MEWITEPQAWIAFLTLAALEIVLGIDNIVFISILVGKLPAHQQARAYRIGLVRLRPRADHGPRRRLLPGLGDHRGGVVRQVGIMMLNLKAGHREAPVHLRQPYVAEKGKTGA
jgi:hypothetical protein